MNRRQAATTSAILLPLLLVLRARGAGAEHPPSTFGVQASTATASYAGTASTGDGFLDGEIAAWASSDPEADDWQDAYNRVAFSGARARASAEMGLLRAAAEGAADGGGTLFPAGTTWSAAGRFSDTLRLAADGLPAGTPVLLLFRLRPEILWSGAGLYQGDVRCDGTLGPEAAVSRWHLEPDLPEPALRSPRLRHLAVVGEELRLAARLEVAVRAGFVARGAPAGGSLALDARCDLTFERALDAHGRELEVRLEAASGTAY